MIEKELVRPTSEPALTTPADPAAEAAVAAELDAIVANSWRQPWWRRGLRRVGSALAHSLDQLVPRAPRSREHEPELRFPPF
jgi:hypothetical protein